MSHRLSKTGIKHLSSTHTTVSELCFYWRGRVVGFRKIASSAFSVFRCVSSQVTLSRSFSWIYQEAGLSILCLSLCTAYTIYLVLKICYVLALVICLYHMTNCPHLESVGKRQLGPTLPLLNPLQQLTDMD